MDGITQVPVHEAQHPDRIEDRRLPKDCRRGGTHGPAGRGNTGGGLPEVAEHRQTGLLVEKEDSRGFAEAITFLLERPETVIHMATPHCNTCS